MASQVAITYPSSHSLDSLPTKQFHLQGPQVVWLLSQADVPSGRLLWLESRGCGA